MFDMFEIVMFNNNNKLYIIIFINYKKKLLIQEVHEIQDIVFILFC